MDNIRKPVDFYLKLCEQGKDVNALNVRSGIGLIQVGPFHFIYKGKAVVILTGQDPYGREWLRLADLCEEYLKGEI